MGFEPPQAGIWASICPYNYGATCPLATGSAPPPVGMGQILCNNDEELDRILTVGSGHQSIFIVLMRSVIPNDFCSDLHQRTMVLSHNHIVVDMVGL